MKTLALSLALAAIAAAQIRPEFEVAAIRPAVDDGGHDSDSDRGYYKVHNLTLKRLIASAWQIDESAISGGPSWINADGFDINARIPSELAMAGDDTVRTLMQNLLADRFHLAIHREPRPISGYELVVLKKGPKMELAKAEQQGSETNSNGLHLTAKNITMEQFARRLSRNRDVGKVVVDKTGLTGRYNFSLDWTPEKLESVRDGDEAPPIFTAIQEQLMLKLESAKVTIQAIVVERAEKPEFDQ
jgi:uncharacterized protein (TIGR03435 family)